jgi:hypothetical protein
MCSCFLKSGIVNDVWEGLRLSIGKNVQPLRVCGSIDASFRRLRVVF